MYIEQLYTGCLAEAAYYIESQGEAAIIDPLRETAPYLELAASRGARIRYVMETHFHADFVSGHLDLARKSGAQIVFGPLARPNYEAYVATDGEDLPLGNIRIRVLHTPGHTMESSTFLLIDEQGREHAIFTGDTLFIGDVGRPDLAVKSDLTREDLAGHLYDSLYNKILPLSDEVIVYPGHGAGSACGKMMSSETIDTLGNQKRLNYALQPMSREAFVQAVTDGLVAPPQYFPKNAVLNRMGYESVDEVMDRGITALDVETFAQLAQEQQALIIDTRSTEDFPQGFVPGSWFIGIDGSFAPWLGALVSDLKQPILLVADPHRVEEVVTRMARVGYDNALGYLDGGIAAWRAAGKPVDTFAEIDATDLEALYEGPERPMLLDVRKCSEYNSEHIDGARNLPLDFIHERVAPFDPGMTYYVHCAGGYRSLVAASILRGLGFDSLINVRGGYKALVRTALPRTEYVAPVTMP
ncbi:MAG: MBL fold metallo-hydrolase [Bacteroidia bacterium]